MCTTWWQIPLHLETKHRYILYCTFIWPWWWEEHLCRLESDHDDEQDLPSAHCQGKTVGASRSVFLQAYPGKKAPFWFCTQLSPYTHMMWPKQLLILVTITRHFLPWSTMPTFTKEYVTPQNLSRTSVPGDRLIRLYTSDLYWSMSSPCRNNARPQPPV